MSKRAPYRANRCVALLSRLFALAIRWEWCITNPTKGVERNSEEPRERYLSDAEMIRLIDTLYTFNDQQVADIIRVMILTGARKSRKFSTHDGTNSMMLADGSSLRRTSNRKRYPYHAYGESDDRFVPTYPRTRHAGAMGVPGTAHRPAACRYPQTMGTHFAGSEDQGSSKTRPSTFLRVSLGKRGHELAHYRPAARPYPKQHDAKICAFD